MPFKCCVPGCRGNYSSEIKVHVFRFPSDESKRQLWINAIPRKDFIYTKSSRVCEQHFTPNNIRWVSSAYDEKTGKTVTVKLKWPQLMPDAVPSIFPGCPTYLSNPKKHKREPKFEEKKNRNIGGSDLSPIDARPQY